MLIAEKAKSDVKSSFFYVEATGRLKIWIRPGARKMHCATSQEAKFYATTSSSRDQEGHGITLPCCLMLRFCSPEMYLCSFSIFPPGSLSFIPFYSFYYNCILMFLVILLFFVVFCYLSLLLRATPLRGVHFFQQQIEGSTWIQLLCNFSDWSQPRFLNWSFAPSEGFRRFYTPKQWTRGPKATHHANQTAADYFTGKKDAVSTTAEKCLA